jgi:hypothetical protein
MKFPPKPLIYLPIVSPFRDWNKQEIMERISVCFLTVNSRHFVGYALELFVSFYFILSTKMRIKEISSSLTQLLSISL